MKTVNRLIVLALCATIVFSSQPCFAVDIDKVYGGKAEKEMPGRSVKQLNEIIKGKEAVISEKAILADKFKKEDPQDQDPRAPLIEYFEDGRIAKMTIFGDNGKPADEYFFNENGRIIQSIHYGYGEEEKHDYDLRTPLIEYKDGKIAKLTIFAANGNPADIYIFDEKGKIVQSIHYDYGKEKRGKDIEELPNKEKAPPLDTKEPPKSKLGELPKLLPKSNEPPVYSVPKLKLDDLLGRLGQYFGLPTKKPVKPGTPKFSPILMLKQHRPTRYTPMVSPTDYDQVVFSPYFNGGSVISVRVERTETLMEN